jgi:sulfide:quinone oxidoreductase
MARRLLFEGMAMNVLIAGGGPAALEAALRLRRVAAEHVAVTLLAPDPAFTYRPLSVLAPFAVGGSASYPLDRIARDARFELHADRLAGVEAAEHAVQTGAGERLSYDALIVATGAEPVSPYERALAFAGTPADEERLHGLVQDVEGGYVHRLAFVVPPGNTWPLPLYELALMLAERGFETSAHLELHLVTPESGPLALFGEQASGDLAALLDTAGIALHANVQAIVTRGNVQLGEGGETLAVERVVTVPLLRGRAIPGLPADSGGFLVTDRHGRVEGVPDVYAAGDGTAFPIKQGGLACQQADAAAEHIAAAAGAGVEPAPFTPVLRGMLLTEHWARFLRRDAGEAPSEEDRVAARALWWPPTKIAGEELSGYLESLDEELGRATGGLPVHVRMHNGDTNEIEILSLLGG